MPLNDLFTHANTSPVGADDEVYPVVDAGTAMFSSPSLFPERGKSGQMNAAEDPGVPSYDCRDC